MRTRAHASVLTLLCLLGLAACATAPTAEAPAIAGAAPGPFDDVRALAIVPFGARTPTVAEHRSEPGRTFDEILSWHPYGAALRPLARLAHRAINTVLDVDREAALARSVDGVAIPSVVAEAMARRLRASGAFEDVRALSSDPLRAKPGEGLVRVTVTSWGIVRVRGGKPDLLSAFADVGGSLSLPGTGVTLWEHREDVTGPDQVPIESLERDHQFARQQVLDVLERAGERLAVELLYARGAGR